MNQVNFHILLQQTNLLYIEYFFIKYNICYDNKILCPLLTLSSCITFSVPNLIEGCNNQATLGNASMANISIVTYQYWKTPVARIYIFHRPHLWYPILAYTTERLSELNNWVYNLKCTNSLNGVQMSNILCQCCDIRHNKLTFYGILEPQCARANSNPPWTDSFWKLTNRKHYEFCWGHVKGTLSHLHGPIYKSLTPLVQGIFYHGPYIRPIE